MGFRLVVFGVVLGLVLVQCRASFLHSTYNSGSDSDNHGQAAGSRKTSCPCGYTFKSGGRIVGGVGAQINEYPYMVAVAAVTGMGGLRTFCGGTLVSSYHAITAAHCTDGNKNLLAFIVGSHAIQGKDSVHRKVHYVNEIIQHEGYEAATVKHDIAILVTHIKVAMTAQVGPACLPTEPITLHKKWVKVTGWGRTLEKGIMSTTLKKVNLKVVDSFECAQSYRQSNPNLPINNGTQFCTYRPEMDSCQGDSGGPVTYHDPETQRYTLVGLVSFGIGCARDKPGVNTRIHAYMPWIVENMKKSTRFDPNGGGHCHKL